MSELKVEIAKITSIGKHENADRLDVVRLNDWDWTIVIGKDTLAVGDLVVYLPIDSVLPEPLEQYLFPEDSKIKLTKSRIKSIKIRQVISQGMVVDLTSKLLSMYPKLKDAKLGDNVAEMLGITKYEPPIKSVPSNMQAKAKARKNEYFKQYTDVQNFKYYPHVFDDKDVVITEKLHGSNTRLALLPRTPYYWWEKILAKLNWLPKYEYCFGSHRVQLQERPKNYKGFYKEPIYEIIFNKYKHCLEPGITIYGEIVGDSVQKGYSYGFKAPDYGFFAFDISKDGKYLNDQDFVDYCQTHDIPMIPALYVGQYDHDTANGARTGHSVLSPDTQPITEGVVIKTIHEQFHPQIGRSILKFINDDYLVKNQTEFH